jgi:hypothetical protein
MTGFDDYSCNVQVEYEMDWFYADQPRGDLAGPEALSELVHESLRRFDLPRTGTLS